MGFLGFQINSSDTEIEWVDRGEEITCRRLREERGGGWRWSSSRRLCGGSCQAGLSRDQALPSAETVKERTPPPSVSPVASPCLCFLPLMRLSLRFRNQSQLRNAFLSSGTLSLFIRSSGRPGSLKWLRYTGRVILS